MSVIVFLALICLQLCHVRSDEYLVSQNIDIDEIIKNDRLTRNYVDCLLERGRCTPEGEQLKTAIPEALQNECAMCNDKHKEGIRKVIHHLIENKPNWWQELASKFDSEGKYKNKYSHYLEEEELNY